MRIFCPCPPCGRQGRPGKGTWQARIQRAAGERPPRARPQRRGSPGPIPNPAVKPAFAESTAARGCGRAGRRARGGRFSIRAGRPGRRARRMRREGPAGDVPAGLPVFCRGRGVENVGMRRYGGAPPKADLRSRMARPTAAHARHPPIAVPGARPEGRPCRAVLRSGAARLLGSALYALRVISPGASDGFLCAVGWSEAGFLSLCAASRFGLLLVTESAYVDYNLKAIYSSSAQCGCRGLCESLILARTFGACKV